MSNEFLIDLGLTALFRLLKDIPKNSQAKEKWKKALLKLRDAISAAFDP